MTIRVGINGFGRIGRQVYRAIRQHHPDRIDVVAVNDVGNPKIMAHLLKYDTNYGRFHGEVHTTADGFVAERYRERLPKADIGRSCVRFTRVDDLDPEALAELIREGARLDRPGWEPR